MPLYNPMANRIKELEAENASLKAIVSTFEKNVQHGAELKAMSDAGDIRGFNQKMGELTRSKIKDGCLSLGDIVDTMKDVGLIQ